MIREGIMVKNLVVIIIIIALVWLILKHMGFIDGEGYKLPDIIGQKANQTRDMLK